MCVCVQYAFVYIHTILEILCLFDSGPLRSWHLYCSTLFIVCAVLEVRKVTRNIADGKSNCVQRM